MSAMKQHSQNFSYFLEVTVQGLKLVLGIDAPRLRTSQMIENWCHSYCLKYSLPVVPSHTNELYLLSYMTYAFKNLIKTFFLVLRQKDGSAEMSS